VSRIFNSRGLVVIDYDKVEIQIEAHLAVARAAGCRCTTVNVPKGQLLYLGNRTADALSAITNDHCQVFYTAPAKRAKRSGRRELTP
jgi:hypothetical protein